MHGMWELVVVYRFIKLTDVRKLDNRWCNYIVKSPQGDYLVEHSVNNVVALMSNNNTFTSGFVLLLSFRISTE